MDHRTGGKSRKQKGERKTSNIQHRTSSSKPGTLNLELRTLNPERLAPGCGHPHSGNAEGGRGKAEIGKTESRKGAENVRHPTSNIES
jgi:hypothetical protein